MNLSLHSDNQVLEEASHGPALRSSEIEHSDHTLVICLLLVLGNGVNPTQITSQRSLISKEGDNRQEQCPLDLELPLSYFTDEAKRGYGDLKSQPESSRTGNQTRSFWLQMVGA